MFPFINQSAHSSKSKTTIKHLFGSYFCTIREDEGEKKKNHIFVLFGLSLHCSFQSRPNRWDDVTFTIAHLWQYCLQWALTGRGKKKHKEGLFPFILQANCTEVHLLVVFALQSSDDCHTCPNVQWNKPWFVWRLTALSPKVHACR